MKSWHLDCICGLAVALARVSRAAKPCLCLFYDVYVSDVGARVRARTRGHGQQEDLCDALLFVIVKICPPVPGFL